MRTSRTLSVAVIAAIFILGAWRPKSVTRAEASPSEGALAPDACSLLTEADVSAALEVKSEPGKRIVPTNASLCIWSSDANNVAGSRRVTLSVMRPGAFERGKTPYNSTITIVPANGIGDQAYYEVFRADSPILVVKKGSVDFNVRILNGLKLKALTLDQEKSKEADLAKAAAARL